MQATQTSGRRGAGARARRVGRGQVRGPQARTGPRPWFRVVPEDGWLMLVLTALLVYVTVWSIQSVTPPWAPGLEILSTVTTVGLLLAYLTIQQGRLPGVLVHTLALALGITFAFAQTDDVSLGGDRRALLSHLLVWFQHALLNNGSSSDNAIFLLFLAILTTLLAYISLWLVLRTRRPWLAVLANGVVLLINLNWSSADHYIFLALYLLVTLLLLVRFNLAENMREWRLRGLRFSPDLSWDFMQAGALFAVLVLLLAYNLPVGTASPAIANALGSPHSPLSALQSRLAELFGGLTGTKGAGPGGVFFGGSLRLVGTVNLPNTVVLHYTVPDASDDTSQYLMTETFDTYNGVSTWTQSTTQGQPLPPGTAEPAPSRFHTLDTYAITFDQAPAGGQSLLFAPGAVPASFSVPADVQVSLLSASPVSWQASHPLSAGQPFSATGYVPTATVAQLESVPYPGASASSAEYPAQVLQEYLPANNGYIDPQVAQTARQWTKGAATMYDAAQMIEDSLRTFKYSTQNPDPPAGEDAVRWFLSRQQGYCTFFASAMALMGRSLGMPTRIVSGFINGAYDQKHNDFQVRGTSAHTWTQIYFGRYGWINFEPTQSFSQFSRGIGASTSPTPTPKTGVPTPSASTGATSGKGPHDVNQGGSGSTANPASPALVDTGLGIAALLSLLLLAMALFLVWWRLLYRALSPVAAVFARISRLGAWAGAPPNRANTPDEYAEQLGRLLPAQRASLRELSDIYDRERWGGGAPGAVARAPMELYARIRSALTPLILRRARGVPVAVLHRVRRRRRGPHDEH